MHTIRTTELTRKSTDNFHFQTSLHFVFNCTWSKKDSRMHYGTKPGHFESLKIALSHERGSERSERASERVSAAEHARNARSEE